MVIWTTWLGKVKKFLLPLLLARAFPLLNHESFSVAESTQNEIYNLFIKVKRWLL